MAETPPRLHHRSLREDDPLNVYACGQGAAQGFQSGYKYSSSLLYRACASFFQTLLLQESKKRMIRSDRAVARPTRCVSLPLLHRIREFAAATNRGRINADWNLLTSRPASLDFSVIQTLALRHDPGGRFSPG